MTWLILICLGWCGTIAAVVAFALLRAFSLYERDDETLARLEQDIADELERIYRLYEDPEEGGQHHG